MKLLKNIITVLSLSVCISFIVPHHGWADYDQTKTVDYTGTIRSSTYENPHGVIKINQGKKIWTVILAPVSRMTDRGLTAEMIKKGNSLRVVGYQHKEKKDEMRAERVFVNDTKYELR
jgi:hypothetical protein